MQMSTALRMKTNEELLAQLAMLPAGESGEVIDGSIFVMGRPGQPHQIVGGEIWGALRFGGPSDVGGDWIIYQEVSVRFATNTYKPMKK
jgi:hypothetical protein